MTRALLVLLLLATGCGTVLRSDARLDPQAISALQTFDYADWTLVLSEHVDGEGRVDYPGLLAKRTPLDRFVALLAEVGPRTRPDLFPERRDQLAYYVNAYNALTMFNVLHRWPLESVNDEVVDFFALTCFPLDGEELSLYALENDLIRPRFTEPRVHFALNCASAGCPRLPAVPFLPATLEEQLAAETQRFLHESRNVSHDDGTVVLSKIFEWYEEDFSPTPLAWIARSAPDLELPAKANVEHRPYDWELNAQ